MIGSSSHRPLELTAQGRETRECVTENVRQEPAESPAESPPARCL
jgi:hypothetical protein